MRVPYLPRNRKSLVSLNLSASKGIMILIPTNIFNTHIFLGEWEFQNISSIFVILFASDITLFTVPQIYSHHNKSKDSTKIPSTPPIFHMTYSITPSITPLMKETFRQNCQLIIRIMKWRLNKFLFLICHPIS